jgi:hypothetical protein
MLNKISLVINRENPPVHRMNRHFLPCNNCGSQSRKIGAGKAPGQSSLLCECGNFVKWIGANELMEIAGQLNNGGQG